MTESDPSIGGADWGAPYPQEPAQIAGAGADFPTAEAQGVSAATAGDLVLKGLTLLPSIHGSQGSITWTSGQITYPHDLTAVPDDALDRQREVLTLYKPEGAFFGQEFITFFMFGNFRPYDPDLESTGWEQQPVMANVHFKLNPNPVAADLRSKHTKVDVRFNILQTPYGSGKDPRIRTDVIGTYSPGGGKRVEINGQIEFDADANVYVGGAPGALSYTAETSTIEELKDEF